jgi:thiazole synthase ThiGH ThiG subunit
MVKLAEREPVRDDRLAARVAVGEDVGGLEELAVSKAADGAALAYVSRVGVVAGRRAKKQRRKSRREMAESSPSLRSV